MHPCSTLKVTKNVSVSARSWSRLVAKIRRLGLVEVQEHLGLGLVPSRTKNRMSRKLRSHLHPCYHQSIIFDVSDVAKEQQKSTNMPDNKVF